MATALSHAEWAIDMEVYFITQIEKVKHLWDSRYPQFTDKTVKRMAYFEIGQKMIKKWPLQSAFFTDHSLLRKFRSLYSYYKQERKKKLAEANYISKWKHFERLGFLESTLAAKENDLDEKDSSRIMEEENAGKKMLKELSLSPSREKKMTDSSTHKCLQEIANYLKKLIKSEESPETAFSHYVEAELKSIDDVSKRELAKLKIQEIIYDMKK